MFRLRLSVLITVLCVSLASSLSFGTSSVQAADPILVGAGDIASCNSSGDEATADLLDGISGTIFTTGDNVYELGHRC